MIINEISKKVLVLGTDMNGKGGMSVLIKSHSALFNPFYYTCSHRFSSRISQILIALSAFIKLCYYCTFKSIKIVHIHTASYRSFYRESIYLLTAKLLKKKVILHLHGGEFELFYNKNKWYCDYICKRANIIVGVSNYFGNLYKRLKLNHNVVVLYNIVEKPLFIKQSRLSNVLNVLFMGAIDDNKGIFEVLDLWARNREIFNGKFHLKICGIGQSQRLIDFINHNNLSANVEYLGWVDTKRKNELLSNADIYIQPSHFESLGIAIIEALSYGIFVIASRTGGIPELVEDDKNGYLIDAGNMEQMKEVLLSLYNNPQQLEDCVDYAKKRASNFYSENLECQIVELYKSLL